MLDAIPIALYTRDSIDGGSQKDPINLLYAGELADAPTVLRITREILRLGTDKGVSDQFFHEPSDPVISHRQDFNQTDAVSSFFGPRIHTRVYQVFTAGPVIGRFVASPIHIDHLSICGDAAASFDLARAWAVDQLRDAGYEARFLTLSAPEGVRQCDGRLTPWDGKAAVITDAAFLPVRSLSERP